MIDKPHFRYHFAKLIVCIALAVLVLVFQTQLVHHLRYFIGGLILAYGIDEIAFEAYCHKLDFIKKSKTYLGLIELVLGVSLLAINLEDYPAVCILWATWTIVRESYEIEELVTKIKSVTLTIASGIESVVVIVFSVMLIAEPVEHHALIHIYLLAVEILLNPSIPLIDEILEDRKQKKQAKEEKEKTS